MFYRILNLAKIIGFVVIPKSIYDHTLKMIHQRNFCDQVYTKGCLYFHDMCWGTGMIYWCVGVYCYSEGGWVIGKSILQ